MKIVDTYYIKYGNNEAAWLAVGKTTEGFDNITSTEIRKILIADEGKVLYKGDEELCESIWLKDDDSIDNYTEGDPKPILEPLETNESESDVTEKQN